MDGSWRSRPGARANISKPPSAYQRLIYYDCLTQNEAALRFLVDQVGVDRVVLGSDWPYIPVYGSHGHTSVVEWVTSMDCLTQDEKDKILWKNLEILLGI